MILKSNHSNTLDEESFLQIRAVKERTNWSCIKAEESNDTPDELRRRLDVNGVTAEDHQTDLFSDAFNRKTHCREQKYYYCMCPLECAWTIKTIKPHLLNNKCGFIVQTKIFIRFHRRMLCFRGAIFSSRCYISYSVVVINYIFSIII